MRYVGNDKGFSLTELIVASGIAVVISSIATFAFSMAMDIFVRTARQYEAETEMLNALYSVKSAFSQSINVTYGGHASAANNSFSTRPAGIAVANKTVGRLFSTDFNDDAMGSGAATYLIALTVREMQAGDSPGDVGYPAAGLRRSRFFGSGVYFQRPTIGAGTQKSGALYIDLEEYTGGDAGGGYAILSSQNAPQMFSRLTEFHVENVTVMNTDGTITAAANGTDNGDTVMSADLRLIMRFFSKGKLSDWRWCPEELMASGSTPFGGCMDNTDPAYYTNVERKVRVVFSNNSYDRGKYLAERPFGYLYFFKSTAPTQREGI